MDHMKISHNKEPIRLFQSDFLEFFTHIHPAVIVIIWTPLVIFFLASAIQRNAAQHTIWLIPIAFLTGLLIWTFTEYMLHRFVFHFRPRNPVQERISFLFHGIHHAQPQCKTRLVMPPVVSIPLALIFFGLFHLVLGTVLGIPQWINPMLSGFILGYLAYDLTHYATHHFPMRSKYAKFLKRHHMLHHYKTPSQRFGVSSILWDLVFNTEPK